MRLTKYPSKFLLSSYGNDIFFGSDFLIESFLRGISSWITVRHTKSSFETHKSWAELSHFPAPLQNTKVFEHFANNTERKVLRTVLWYLSLNISYLDFRDPSSILDAIRQSTSNASRGVQKNSIESWFLVGFSTFTFYGTLGKGWISVPCTITESLPISSFLQPTYKTKHLQLCPWKQFSL